jgi:polyphosphate kinase
VVAPTSLRPALLDRIRREAEHARAGRRGRIVAKLNNLVDGALIEALYDASAAGVEIDLIVRGICCLRPGVRGLSERIRVLSIIDRYLEHARVFVFDNDGAPEYWLSSADWMPRNLDRRVEIAFPVLDSALQAEIQEVLDIQLADSARGRVLGADGGSRRRPTSEPALRSQERLYEIVALHTSVPKASAR